MHPLTTLRSTMPGAMSPGVVSAFASSGRPFPKSPSRVVTYLVLPHGEFGSSCAPKKGV